MGWWQKNMIFSSALPCGQHAITREHRRTLLLSARTTTVNVHRVQQWSELQRDDRIAAECASHPLPRNKFSLLCLAGSGCDGSATTFLPRIISECRCAEREGRRSLLQIGPTSRTRDSV